MKESIHSFTNCHEIFSRDVYDIATTKGQLISECLFDFFQFSKKSMKSKKWSNHKTKAL